MAKVILRDTHVENSPGGVRIHGVPNIHLENLSFHNVDTPFDVSGVKYGHVSRTNITEDKEFRERAKSSRTTIGWRRGPKRPPLPIFCPNCKSISSSKRYVFGDGYFWFRNNKETCPVCNVYGAELSEGLFDLSKEIAQVLTAPDMTYAMLKAITTEASMVISGQQTLDKAAMKINDIHPKTAQTFIKAKPFGRAATYLVPIILTIVGLWIMNAQLDEAKQQTAIVKSQSDNQRRENVSLQKVLEALLEKLSELQIVPENGNDEKQPQEIAEPHAKQPAEKEPPSEPGPD